MEIKISEDEPIPITFEKSIKIKEIPKYQYHPVYLMPKIPDYENFQQLLFVNKAREWDVQNSQGIAVHVSTNSIFITDYNNSNIHILTEEGEYQRKLENQALRYPFGILTFENNVYVTDYGYHALLKFTLPEFELVKRVGNKGYGREEFQYPRNIAISPNNLICVADHYNNRIQILDLDLIFQGALQHRTMVSPVDIKFSATRMYVLSSKNNPCVHIFTLTGEKIGSIVRRGEGMLEDGAYFFCLDADSNIVISDPSEDNLKVFSPEGDFLQTVGIRGYLPGMFLSPTGIALLKQTQLVCVSRNCLLQILS